MENKLKEFNDALCDVRKAHRLIYSYQQRMLDLAYFVKTKLDFPDFQAKKRFSSDISKNRSSKYLRIWNDMWAWDFIYSYMFEYYLGEIELDNGDSCALSIIQYSDTGYFDADGESRTDVNSFAEEKESSSKLLFILEVKPKKTKEWIWNIHEISLDKEYGSSKHVKDLLISDKGNMQVLYSFTLDRFLNENTSLNALQEFVDYCRNNDVVELSII